MIEPQRSDNVPGPDAIRPAATPAPGVPAGPAALALAFLLLVGSAIALNVILVNLSESRTLVLRASTILRDTAELQAAVRTAETGQRGFILTGERRYLAPYEEATRRVWAELEQLERGVGSPDQAGRLRALRPLLQAKLDELAETVALRGTRDFAAALAVVRTDVGQTLMEDIDARLLTIRRAEEGLLADRAADLEQRARWATAVAGLTGLLAVASAAMGIAWMVRQRSQARLLAAERRFRSGLEDEVAQRTHELTRINRELDAFAYTISHDLRAPLRAMHGYADALAEDYGALLPQEGRRFTQRIAAAATRMESLIQDILTYSRLARDQVSLRPVALEPVVDRAIADAAPAVAETGARITVERPLPDVRAHTPILAQAIENLLSNAMKFVAPGVRPEIRFSAEPRPGGRVHLTVADNGIGLEAEHHERVFRPFERLHGVESYPGTGIGLAIVRRSLERMGGSCGVASSPGAGSRFWIELQGAAGSEAAAEPPPADRSAA